MIHTNQLTHPTKHPPLGLTPLCPSLPPLPGVLAAGLRWRSGGKEPGSPGVEAISLLLGDAAEHLLRQTLGVGEDVGGGAEFPHGAGHHCGGEAGHSD